MAPVPTPRRRHAADDPSESRYTAVAGTDVSLTVVYETDAGGKALRLLAQDPAVVPIPGSRSPAHVVENAGSARIALDLETLRRVDEALRAFEVAGGTLL
jgi:hypothetical protein